MHIFFSEYQTNYNTYTFGYTAYCQPEHTEEIPEVYQKGFLPYTGDITLKKSTFYMARSLRIDLDRFEDTSENRRVDRKASALHLTMEVIPIEQFDVTDANFVAFCTQYAAERFAGGEMDPHRFAYILSRQLITHIIAFTDEAANTYGYVLVCQYGKMLHYWFSFFNTAYLKSHALGKWMMWKTIRWAKEHGLAHVYLGTCYRTKSLYKVRDHKGIAFFDGMGWNSDAQLLKSLCQQDEEPARQTDLFKLEEGTFRELYSTVRY